VDLIATVCDLLSNRLIEYANIAFIDITRNLEFFFNLAFNLRCVLCDLMFYPSLICTTIKHYIYIPFIRNKLINYAN